MKGGLMRMRSSMDSKMGLRDMCREVVGELKVRAGGVAVEVGSFAGESAVILSEFFDNVICIDPHIPYTGDSAGRSDQISLAKRGLLGRMERVRKISLLSMSSVLAARFIVKDDIDLVYIDGKHDYDSVMMDLVLWGQGPRFLGGHDYNPKRFPGVVMAVHDYLLNREKILDKSNICVYRDTSWLVRLK